MEIQGIITREKGRAGIVKTLEVLPPYDKQKKFFLAKTKYVAYGGARGGGKSWAARVKASLLAFNYPGIQILILRRTYPELYENHIIPLLKMLSGAAAYRDQEKAFAFPNGSRIKLGYCDTEKDVLQYQGQAYDVIVMEEATQFTEFQFQTLTESNRASGHCARKFPPRMYFTCNPGGVGHAWVKRLFIDKKYQQKERPEDYTFIKSLVYENRYLMENDPDYIRALENLPEDRRKAMLEGDWDVYEGQYFPEFRRDVHVCRPFTMPEHWRRYAAMDYGLDMLAVLFVAVDEQNRAYVYKEIYESGLIISEACERIKDFAVDDDIYLYLAPPDLWNARQETGKSMAYIFSEHGVGLTRSNSARVDGWLAVKEWLKVYRDERGQGAAGLTIFDTCLNLIRCLPQLQHDEKKPSDAAVHPHEITHAPDALRYFCVYWAHAAETPRAKRVKWSADLKEDYFSANDEGRKYLISTYGEPENLYCSREVYT